MEPIELAGIFIASSPRSALGLLGPEAPLIAIGGGLGVLAVHLVKRDAPEMRVSWWRPGASPDQPILGSPLPAAFLMMEVSGIGGATLGVVLAPGCSLPCWLADLHRLRRLDRLRHLLLGVPDIPSGR